MTDRSADGPGKGDRTDDEGSIVRRRLNDRCAPSVAVIQAVADATSRDPTTLPLLARTVNPDAVNALFADRGDPERSASLSFTYAGTEVTVDDSVVVVEPHGDVR